MSDEEQETYRFKYTNYDLGVYCENMRARASSLRSDARLLMVRADQIEEEIAELKKHLIPITGATP